MTPDELEAWLRLGRERVSIQYHAEHIAQLSVIDAEQARQLVLLHGPRVAMQQALSWPGPELHYDQERGVTITVMTRNGTVRNVPYSGHLSESVKSKPCHTCANHEGSYICCAMYPYGPESDECPDWEGKNSPDVRRRKLTEQHRQQLSELEARHEKERDRLENDIKLQIAEVPLPEPQSVGDRMWDVAVEAHRYTGGLREDVALYPFQSDASLLDRLEPGLRQGVFQDSYPDFFEMASEDVVLFEPQNHTIAFSDRWHGVLPRLNPFSVIFPASRGIVFCPQIIRFDMIEYRLVTPTNWGSCCQVFS